MSVIILIELINVFHYALLYYIRLLLNFSFITILFSLLYSFPSSASSFTILIEEKLLCAKLQIVSAREYYILQ